MRILKILLKLILSCFAITFIYSVLVILALILLIISLVGVGIFAIGVVGSIFDITNLITKMGAVAFIFVGMGCVCLGIFLMVLIIEIIKKFINKLKQNIGKIFK